MAFMGVLMMVGVFNVIAWGLLFMIVGGILLLILSLVFTVLYLRGKKRFSSPRRWQKIVSIFCFIFAILLLVPPVGIYLYCILQS